MKIANLILIAGISVLINSCRKDDYDYCTSLRCSSHCYHVENCYCVPDSVNFHCPPEIIHGIYDFNSCDCRCERGWTRTFCDQRDTNFYISFRFGTDTLNLSGLIRTSYYSLSWDTSKFFEFAGSLPSGSEIDTITLTQLRNIVVLGSTSHPLCVTDSTCTHLEMLMHSGETAIALSGVLTIDTWGSYLDFGGTFKANLYTSTGKSFFMRDGKYFLPFIK